MQIMTRRIATAILIGAVLGATLAYMLMPAGKWQWLGVPFGGSVAWLAYTRRDIAYHAPRIFNSIAGWKIDWLLTKRIVSFFGLTALLGAEVALSIDLLIYLPITDRSLASLGIGFYLLEWGAVGAAGWLGALMVIRHHLKTDSQWRAVGERALLMLMNRSLSWQIRWINPIGIPLMLTWIIIKNIRAILRDFAQMFRLLGRGLLTLFVAVHSHDALDCFLYAALGVAVGTVTTHTVWIIAVSAFAGLGLAFVGRYFAGLVPKHLLVH